MSSKAWLPYVGLAVAAFILAGAIPFVAFRTALLVLGASLLAIAVAVTFGGRRDKYDLGLLREIEEREQIAQLEVPEPAEYDSVLCTCCHTVYSTRFPACPNCAKKKR